MSLSEAAISQSQTRPHVGDTTRIGKYYYFHPKIYSWLKKINTRSIVLLLVTMILCFWMMGCKMEKENWIDQMLSEMETAAIKAQRAPRSFNKKGPATSAAAQKYFRPGMPKEEAFLLLQDLKNYGFFTSENRHEGGRIWPDGEFKTPESGRYADERSVRVYKRQYPKGASRFTARMEQYDTVYLIIPKGTALGFTVVDGEDVISDLRANVWITFL